MADLIVCTTYGCGELAVNYCTCEGEGKYPYCAGCVESLTTHGGDEINLGPIVQDEVDYGVAFGRLIGALLPYWERQESMPPEQALRKLLNERDLYHAVLSDMADGVDDDYSAWAAMVIGVATASKDCGA